MNDFEEVVRDLSDGVLIKLYVVPNSKKSAIVGLYGSPVRLKVKIAAVPEKGRANKELIKFLSPIFEVSASNIEIRNGDFSGFKDLYLQSLSKTDFIEKLDNYLKK